MYQGLYPPHARDYEADRALTRTLTTDYKEAASARQTSSFKDKMRWPLMIWVCLLLNPAITVLTHLFVQCLLGTSCVVSIFSDWPLSDIQPPRLTMADGMFTPSVSVTSAVGGIAVAQESVAAHITPISIVCPPLLLCREYSKMCIP